ncbi:MAG: sn-glycerol-3-phosphate ABC transporter ATP-binding protein UgpC [Coprobacillus cateniformis]|uniref:ABC transporter ATP-binding protein n=1 Tax=Longibaculum muris TaxID=1796628 RepID=UPI003AB8B572|nr:sn-glycerol-3-phosphate ABC transporter ATP-binding protein UgpC [Coprobacillus cateniformis]
MATLSLKHIDKIYDNNVQAVFDFNLDIADKEFIVFVGPSGCGKSTTLRMIAGLEDISSGELYIDDKLMNDISPKDRDIAMVFQSYALYPHMTVYENMAFGLKIAKVPKEEIDRRVRSVAKAIDIEQYLERKPKALSGGQRQRVALGRAIVREPKVFLMDEPLSNLDAKLRVQMRVEILKIYQQLGTTFIYVTHDQTEAMTMGTRIVVMKDGRVQQVAAPTFLYEHPVNKFVAGFIGSPQMNFRDGTISEKDGKLYIELTDITLEIPEDKAKVLKEKGYVGKTVTMGIRPEDISTHPQYIMHHPEASFQSEVDVVELMGSESFIHMTKDGSPFVVKVPGSTPLRAHDEGSFTYLMNKTHYFDKDTEINILENLGD